MRGHDVAPENRAMPNGTPDDVNVESESSFARLNGWDGDFEVFDDFGTSTYRGLQVRVTEVRVVQVTAAQIGVP